MTLAILMFCSVFVIGQNTAPPPEPKVGTVDILSDTQGVDFGPYLKDILSKVRKNWLALIPESAQTKKGKLTIEFAITREGKLADMRLVATSGDSALDRPAWGSITASTPFPPLPSEFTGPYLALRFPFYYNPEKGNLAHYPSKSGIAVSISAPGTLQVQVGGSEVVTATVTGTTELAVEWSVTGSGCSGSPCGKMTGDVYVAPSVLPSPPLVTLTATSKADPTAKASVTVHIVQPSPSH
jgi:TonB family protein